MLPWELLIAYCACCSAVWVMCSDKPHPQKKKSDVYSRGSPGRALSVSHMISLPHKSPPPPPPPPLRPWSTYVKWKCNVCRACEPYSRGNGVQRRKVEQFVSSCRRCRCSSTEVCSKLFSETVRCFLSPLQWVGGRKKKERKKMPVKVFLQIIVTILIICRGAVTVCLQDVWLCSFPSWNNATAALHRL